MERSTKPQSQGSRLFTFNSEVPGSGNIHRDRAEIKVRFEKALDDFFQRYATQQLEEHQELDRL